MKLIRWQVGLFGADEPLLFGKLSAAMFSMFQVCTGIVARIMRSGRPLCPASGS